MKRLMKTILAICLLAVTTSAHARLCKNCKGKPVVMMMGKCNACGGDTSSAAYMYCKKCSKKTSDCEMCGKAELGDVKEHDPGPVSVKEESLVDAGNACAVSLYQQLKSARGNLFISPYSISSAMAMCYGGARENTASEMAKALGLTMAQDKVPAAFKALNDTLHANAKKSGQKLSIANGLCLTGGDVGKAFKDQLETNYAAEIFKGDLAAVNGWVKKKTEGKIDEILNSLNPNTVCVLLNAIYFKGTWASQFDPKRTYDATFKITADKSVKVPMMYQKADFKMRQFNGFKMITLPYAGKKSSMAVLLPDAVDGLAKLEEGLSNTALAGWLAQVDKTPADETIVYLPKFKLETEYDLVPTFKALGVKDAFDMAAADFTGMGWKKGDLCIAQIKHKAFVEVNEEGTEAAAATAVEMMTKSARRYPEFRADHPFLFLIRDNETGSILFMGRVTNPK